jgi:hypothetical protein
MRVNISYSVELEDVLEELKLLYQREYTKMRLVASESEKSLNQNYTEKNLSEIAMALEDYRKAMASFDVKLAEISNILNGYHSIKLDPSTDANQEIQEEIEVNNE